MTQDYLLLLPQSKIKAAIHQLKPLISITQQDFKRLYMTCIERFADFIETDTALQSALEKAIRALKYRRGYLLPLGADSETCFREQEEWSYAIFIAALLEKSDEVIQPLLESHKDNKSTSNKIVLLKVLLPAEGFKWLHQNKKLWQEFTRYLQGEYNQENTFLKLIQPKKPVASQIAPINTAVSNRENIKKPEKIEKTREIDPTDETDTIENITHKNEENLDESENTEPVFPYSTASSASSASSIQEIDLNDLFSHQPISKPKIKKNIDLDSMINFKLPNFKAEDFFHWLKKDLKNKTITLNAPTAYIHIVKEGVLILIPQAIRTFLEAQTKRLNIPQQMNLLKAQIDLTRILKKSDLLLCTANNSTIHTYYRGHWQNRQLLSGMVVPIHVFWEGNPRLPINPELTPDPIKK